MKHMKMTAKEGEDNGIQGQEYPHGLELHMDENAIQKLGLKELPVVGSHMRMAARAHVTGAMMHHSEGGKKRMLHLQITHMSLGKDGDHEETDGDHKGKKLYGGAKEK